MSRAVLRQSSWLLTVPLTGLAVAYLAFVWLPGHRAIRDLRNQAVVQRQFVAQAAPWPEKLKNYRQELDRTVAAVKSWEKTLPRKRDMSLFYGKIYAAAKNAGLTITRFDPQTAVAYEKFHRIPIAIHCTGPFVQVFDFLRSVEGLPGAVWIEKVRIEKLSDNGKDVYCELILAVFSDNLHVSDYAKRGNCPIYEGAVAGRGGVILRRELVL